MKVLSKRYLLEQVNPKYGYIALFACCFSNGALDAGVFNNYGVFAAMQTGNTIILFLNTARLPVGNTFAYAKTLVVLISFFIGALLTSQVWPRLMPGGPLRRSNLSLIFLIQAALVFIGAALITSRVIPMDNQGPNGLDSDPRVIGVLPPLALQAGATIATSRQLGFAQEIPVNVLTSTYAALAADPKLFGRNNPSRDRRVLAVLCTMAGAMVAAWIMRKLPDIGFEAVLWMSAAIKAVTAFGCYLFLSPAIDAEDGDSQDASAVKESHQRRQQRKKLAGENYDASDKV